MIRHLDDLPPTITAGACFVPAPLGDVLRPHVRFGRAGSPERQSACGDSRRTWHGALPSPTLYAVAVWVSYKAAVASALGFGQALKEANSWVKKPRYLCRGPLPPPPEVTCFHDGAVLGAAWRTASLEEAASASIPVVGTGRCLQEAASPLRLDSASRMKNPM